MNGSDNCIKRLKEISDKNKVTKEYSLGDALLKYRFEQQLLKYCGYTQAQVESFSPSYYGDNT